jgi:hypothetical protein
LRLISETHSFALACFGALSGRKTSIRKFSFGAPVEAG